ncbi:MAG: DNA gyrase/topoisomerase IV subunit A [Saprospiraceae bacterium]|nr:DNA gyrase/topoisomerase IV subunit A [Bacteroidia bacterium]MBT8229897.1 DNA gyrase/topoisomerase IV subunit A [Bacteroidia bacterium]NNF22282.1 DNA gyrase/topoisomerase IV subunit A [Saprospiraceae bacterium]NNK89096.1 DNA gyrase/topoisomerase IV subunit A [Saprospiraceae bacterium]
MSDVRNLDLNVNSDDDRLMTLEGMYKEYFLDYASYVILERAVPAIEDGLKPVQRRILHSMKNMDDGRYNKVANIIGQTMQYHPHGDAAIGDALVKLGQKDLLIDTQGNWGDVQTGDSPAASRYIEARLTKFALDVVFNPQTTDWQLSYDGRNKEPITLPVKFPLVLTQGVEGIAVGLSTKILPHNFIELIKASIKILQEKRVKIYPDFYTGGSIDVSDYNAGKRGGRVKVRATIEQRDKKTLAITELPFGVTTNNLIDSILKANDKGKIQIRKVTDNTAANVEILLELQSGVSPDLSMDALYAFTNCEISISPNAVVIIDNKPHFLSVEELLKISTDKTKDLLKQELEIKKAELQEKWHNISLEKIFIENRIYRDIEEAESFEEVISIIEEGLKKYVFGPSEKTGKSDKRIALNRDITRDDIVKLTEIKIKKISKYNKFKTDEVLAQILEDLKQVNHDLKHLTDFAISYFQNLLEKYGEGRERKTQIKSFDTIKATRVVAKNAKLYINRKEGFIGTGLKKDEYICDCSDIDDIIAFAKSGIFKVVRNDDKVFIGKNILHADVWKKNDDRKTYNMIYLDAKTGRAMAKRFNVTSITRDKAYDLTTAVKGNKVLYFSAYPNGEADKVQIQLSPGCKANKKVFEFDFSSLDIKGRGSKGNIVTRYPVRKITLLEVGSSSLGEQKIWMDEVSGRLNKEERGKYLGSFDTGDNIIALYKNGNYEVFELDFNKKLDASNIIDIRKHTDDTVISCVYFEGDKGWTMVKRFKVETQSTDQTFKFISEHNSSKLYFATLDENPIVNYSFKKNKVKTDAKLNLAEFIDVKGWKALGNKLGEFKILKIDRATNDNTQKTDPKSNSKTKSKKANNNGEDKNENLSPGDTIEFDF